MGQFENKVVIITGAASGIGRATAIAFALEGAKVVVSDMKEEEGIKTVKLIEEKKGSATFIKCDVSSDDEVKNLIAKTVEKFGGLDFAFNNAGIEGVVSPTTDCSFENWNRTIDINLKGVWLCMKYQIPAMIKNGNGSIVNCSSIAGLVGFEGSPAYVASKHGVIGLTQTAALENAKKKIRINAVCPGPIETSMLERLGKETIQALATQTPMGRLGVPHEIADAVIWLCSEKSSYITGQSITIDGGWVAH